MKYWVYMISLMTILSLIFFISGCDTGNRVITKVAGGNTIQEQRREDNEIEDNYDLRDPVQFPSQFWDF